MTEPEELFEELHQYLLKFPKNDTAASAIGCLYDLKIVNTIVATAGTDVDIAYVSNPIHLINMHTQIVKDLIDSYKKQGLLCIVRTYPYISGDPNGLRIRTRLQFGDPQKILLNLLPPNQEEQAYETI